jgi:hypothetical protein
MYYFIGPESNTYHNRRDCPRISHRAVYWPVDSSETVPEGRQFCGDCAWIERLRDQAVTMLAFKPTQRRRVSEVLLRLHCSTKVGKRIVGELIVDGLVRENDDGTLSLTSAGNALRNRLLS